MKIYFWFGLFCPKRKKDLPIQTISLSHLALAFVPILGLLFILNRWVGLPKETVLGVFRMLIQLLIVGYFLVFLFNSNNALIVIGVLTVMIGAASWISLRTITIPRKKLFAIALISIIIGGGINLIVITQAVLQLDPWYSPQYMIPLAGMIFGSSMNSISLAAERFEVELRAGKSYKIARGIALKTALIPITNSLFAVGLVSLPGMMTGQILSGVAPLIAVRYQIMVMAMLLAASGFSAACFLWLLKSRTKTLIPPEQGQKQRKP